MLDRATKLGWMVPANERATAIKRTLTDFGISRIPKSGWDAFCFELDLVLIAMPDRVNDRNTGYAELARKVSIERRKLDSIRSRFYDFNHNIDFSLAALFSKADVNDNFRKIDELILSLDTVSKWLSENPQSPRWRESARRQHRVELAVKVSTLFEDQFEEEAKPIGGSDSFELEATNTWTRFFQAVAFILLGERVSPDRQAVLWEAHGWR